MNERTSRKIAAVIVAAGRGLRAGGDVPKQFRRIGAYTVAEWSLRAFAQHPEVDELVLVHPDDGSVPVNLETTSKNFRFCLESEPVENTDKIPDFAQGTPPRTGPNSKIFRMVTGGATRDASVKLGLQAVSIDCDAILIHDAARPCIPSDVISAVIEALNTNSAAAPALPVVDALWTGENAKVTGVQSRDALFRAQTPQGFHADAIHAAHAAHPGGAADDVEVARAAGLDVQIVPGDERNLKITTPEDFARASAILEPMMDIRTGNGFDVHRFGPGDHVMLCGVKIPHERGLQGHSDADVGLHTITDAIYGALAAGDIGQHFPPSDSQWKGASSDLFLSHARELADEKGFTITHIDCTLICEFPKIGPHTAAMRSNLAELLHISGERISVKATTSERLGFTGRGEGIACMATATVVKS